MSTIRLKRLAADFQKLSDYIDRHPRLKLLETDGDPPEKYIIEFKIRSLRQVGEELKEVSAHQVEIVLPRDYPRTAPQCRMLTPVFHPNIAPHAICIGDHWSAGEPIWSLVSRIGEMLAYQSYNIKSPLNGEAARWAEKNTEELPLDRVSMLVDMGGQSRATVKSTALPSDSLEPQRAAPPRVTTPEGSPQRPVAPVESRQTSVAEQGLVEDLGLALQCPRCSEKYRVQSSLAGKKVRCKKCQTIIAIPDLK